MHFRVDEFKAAMLLEATKQKTATILKTSINPSSPSPLPLLFA